MISTVWAVIAAVTVHAYILAGVISLRPQVAISVGGRAAPSSSCDYLAAVIPCWHPTNIDCVEVISHATPVINACKRVRAYTDHRRVRPLEDCTDQRQLAELCRVYVNKIKLNSSSYSFFASTFFCDIVEGILHLYIATFCRLFGTRFSRHFC